jgi:plasmid stabilization system protein ParE
VKPYIVAPDAEDDLKQIWPYLLGEAGLAVANRIQEELVDAFEGLADIPSKGHSRPDQPGCPLLQRVSVHDRVSASDDGRDCRRPAWQARPKTVAQGQDVAMIRT